MKPKIQLENLKARLQWNVAKLTQKIELLDTIRAREDKKATPEEVKQLDKLNIPFLDASIVSLMLEAKARKREKKDPGQYKPFLIQIDDISKLELEYKISEMVAQHEPFHYDFIIISHPHCSPIQIDFDGENIRVS